MGEGEEERKERIFNTGERVAPNEEEDEEVEREPLEAATRRGEDEGDMEAEGEERTSRFAAAAAKAAACGSSSSEELSDALSSPPDEDFRFGFCFDPDALLTLYTRARAQEESAEEDEEERLADDDEESAEAAAALEEEIEGASTMVTHHGMNVGR